MTSTGGMSRTMAALIAMIAVFAWWVLATPRLEAQGLYHDEVHQALPAFAWVGEPITRFAQEPVLGLPLFNMNYSGALKTALYGLQLAASDGEFDLRHWRLQGIAAVGFGLVAFIWFARTVLGPAAMFLFLALFLTNISVILASRHDWGPAAFAMALRLLLLGSWLHGEAAGRSRKNSLLLGLIVGVSAFEKLNNLVLLAPLAWIVLRRVPRVLHALSAAVGFLLGAAPLFIVNVRSLLQSGTLFSLADASTSAGHSDILEVVGGILGSGSGERITLFILDLAPGFPAKIEPFLFAASCLLSVLVVVYWARGGLTSRLARDAFVGWGLVVAAICFLPRRTDLHHWLVATPFACLGLALAAQVAGKRRLDLPGLMVVAGCLVLSGLAGARVAGLLRFEQALYSGAASMEFHPEVNRLAHASAQEPPSTLFIATTWGIANALDTWRGRQGTRELYWNYAGTSDLRYLLGERQPATVVLVGRKGRGMEGWPAEPAIVRDMRALPEWVELSPGNGRGEFETVDLHRFVRHDPRSNRRSGRSATGLSPNPDGGH